MMNQIDHPGNKSTSIDLATNCDWWLRPDAANQGLSEGWFKDPGSIANHARAKRGAIGEPWQSAFGFDSDVNIAWYSACVAVPADWSPRRSWLEFESVATFILGKAKPVGWIYVLDDLALEVIKIIGPIHGLILGPIIHSGKLVKVGTPP